MLAMRLNAWQRALLGGSVNPAITCWPCPVNITTATEMN
jgi:hypothetical protein